ncbi:hypothetical protein CR513_23909, partial [Mucuna pruriens]
DEQSRLSAEAEHRQAEAEERYRLVEERHLEAMKQIAALKAASKCDQTVHEEIPAQPFWGQLFCREIDETPIPPNFREVVVEPFDGSQDPYAHLQALQT